LFDLFDIIVPAAAFQAPGGKVAGLFVPVIRE